MVKPIQVSLIKSPIGRPEKHRRILRALGLTKMHRPVDLYSSPQVLGAVRKVIHLVKVVERQGL
jgi:large subunit ribosomal protein L30